MRKRRRPDNGCAALHSERAERYYLLARGTIGLPTLPLYLRTLLGAAIWCGGPPLLARLLGCVGRRGALHRLERYWARGVCRFLGLTCELQGLEHIAAGERYVVVSLHEGLGDILGLLQLPLDLRFVARDELFRWRFLGPYLHDTGQIEVSPERGVAGYRTLLREARQVFAGGESLVLFPQGSILGIETSLMAGAFALARTLRRPILPIALTGSHRIWEHPYSPRLRYGQRLSLRVLPALSVEEVLAQPPRQLRDEVQRRLKQAAFSGELAAPRRFVPARDGYWDGYAFDIDPAFPELAADVARRRAQGSCRRQQK